jgi:hypothetical protein
VEYISDESGDDVEEHGDQDKLSNFNEPESDHSGELPDLKRGRKRVTSLDIATAFPCRAPGLCSIFI